MSIISITDNYRWNHYFLRSGGECISFWEEHLSLPNRQILFILGLGFDPRMCFGLNMILNASPGCIKECILVKYDEGMNSPSHQYDDLIKKNHGRLLSLMENGDAIKEVPISMWSADRKRRTYLPPRTKWRG